MADQLYFLSSRLANSLGYAIVIEAMNLNRQSLEKFLPLIIAAAIILLGGSGFFLYKYQAKKMAPTSNGEASAEQVKQVVAEIGKLMELPQGEEPTLATVTDKSKLEGQAFFAKAQNGDQVLIYSQAKKAILYSPSQKKIIEVAPINIGSDSAQQNTQARIVLRNGTSTTGLTTKIEAEIKKSFADANIIAKDNAGSSAYDKSVVVYLNDNAKAAAQNLAQILNITAVATMPEGEKTPENADLVIILGKDKI